ncbi:uncharacterized protein BX663DRAFT_555299 [Cokeromyces recurvatus]|uniref:uncharacterized protein n=1 Tax=Cokeromyces recurvatus TaxID=90255 RepID=UPI002220E586|nr:uncharacterized protein BX663DRAFT_555299 [Cokeromyces recurvatus]KAI7898969.1 hypothetical protein BX663DRAFT_555299 [Cokeromyces recurvatus]
MQSHSLPTEILAPIFKLLHKSSLYPCLSVCKQWHRIAAHLYFGKLQLTGENIKRLHLILSNTQGNQLFSWGPLVNELKISYDEKETPGINLKVWHSEDEENDYRLSKDEFITLVSNFTNVKKIDLSESKHFRHYINLLREVHNLHQLAEIPKGGNGMNHLEYYLTCHHFRNTLTHLFFYYYKSNCVINNNISCISLLPEFKHLTHLSFQNNYDTRLTLFDILTICPNLITLAYISNFDVSDNYMNQSMNKLINPYNKIENKNLRKLDLAAPSIITSYINYITKYSPAGLETINIRLMEDDLFDWFEEEGIEPIIKLGQRMSLVKNLSIYANPEYAKEINEEIEEDADTKITQFYRFIDALKGDRQLLYCSCTYSEYKNGQNLISIVDDKYLRFHYGMSYADFPLDMDRNNEEWRADPFRPLFLPDTLVSRTGLEMMDDFTFYILEKELYQIPIALLQYVFNNCPYLSFMEIRCMNADLEFVAGIKQTPPPHHHHHNNAFSRKKTTQENITRIKLTGCVGLSSELAYTLSTCLPNIEQIMLNKGYINKNHHSYRITKRYTVNLNYFTCLHTLYYELNDEVEFKNDQVFIEFLYDDEDESRNSCFELIKTEKMTYKVEECTIASRNERDPEKTCVVTIKCKRALDKVIIYSDCFFIFQLYSGKLGFVKQGSVNHFGFIRGREPVEKIFTDKSDSDD